MASVNEQTLKAAAGSVTRCSDDELTVAEAAIGSQSLLRVRAASINPYFAQTAEQKVPFELVSWCVVAQLMHYSEGRRQ